MNTTTSRFWHIEFVLLAAIWGSSFLFTRVAAHDLGALPTAAACVVIGFLFLMPSWLAKG